MVLPERAAARVVSCDVFDTLLHRDHRSERRRFRDIADLASRRLAVEKGIALSSAAILHARIEVQRHAYRALDLARPTGDVRFADMIDAMARILDLDTDAAAILHDAEIAVEQAQLTPNKALFTWLTAQARVGCRIIAVSDTYHEASTIAQLLAALAPRHPVEQIHTSADHNATKRTGALFGAVLRAEGVAPADILHIGDDERADITMARAAGLRTLQVARPRHLIFRRRTDAVQSRLVQALQTALQRSARTRSGLA
ncbi:HAD family hydrolase [Methylobacterium sp. 77]|uniref:HAD family hydrolase n=1 Tax=Methylobacterium sp. 77 TaxID=1101192 RepID=UPI00039E61E1|nr:HAD family hydrolase [Methylobacterium sp. 77]